MRKSYKFKLFNNKKKSKRLSRELWQFHLIYNHSLRLIKTHYFFEDFTLEGMKKLWGRKVSDLWIF